MGDMSDVGGREQDAADRLYVEPQPLPAYDFRKDPPPAEVDALVEKTAIWLFQYRTYIHRPNAFMLELDEEGRQGFRRDARSFLRSIGQLVT